MLLLYLLHSTNLFKFKKLPKQFIDCLIFKLIGKPIKAYGILYSFKNVVFTCNK